MAAILEAAARLFDRGSATTNGIARLAGVSIGSLYEYFPNKDAILESLVLRHVQDALGSLRQEIEGLASSGVSLDAGVRRLMTHMLELHDDRPGLHRIFVARLMAMPAVRRRIVEGEAEVRRLIARWLGEHPEVRVPSTALAARVVVEGTDALVHRYVENAEGIEPSAFIDELTRLWTGYLRGS